MGKLVEDAMKEGWLLSTAVLKGSSKEEILKHTKRFLEVAGQGTCEIYPLYEMPEHN